MGKKSEAAIPGDPLGGRDFFRRSNELLAVLGTEPESDFNDLAELAASMCSTPVGLVTLLGAAEQYHKGSVGAHCDRMPLGETFCEYTVRGEGLFVVKDVKADERFRNHRFVKGEPGVRFYAGVPVYGPSGDKVGALCVLDSVRRELKPWQSRSLMLLARQVNGRLELKLRQHEAEQALERAARNDLLFTTFADNLPFPCYIKDREHRLLFYNAPLAERFGVDREQWLGRTSYELWPAAMAERIQAAEEKVFATGEPSDLRVEVPGSAARPPMSLMLHQRLCRVPAGEPVLGVLALEASAE